MDLSLKYISKSSNVSCELTTSRMACRKPKNYLRTYRKHSGLAQGDISYVVNARTKGEWSRYERSLRQPSLRTAFACEEAFGIPVNRLFAGLRESVGDETIERMQLLESRLKITADTTNPARRWAWKIHWLGQRLADRLIPDISPA
jgi:transcriptional regulator with XRE-family HTH domain